MRSASSMTAVISAKRASANARCPAQRARSSAVTASRQAWASSSALRASESRRARYRATQSEWPMSALGPPGVVGELAGQRSDRRDGGLELVDWRPAQRRGLGHDPVGGPPLLDNLALAQQAPDEGPESSGQLRTSLPAEARCGRTNAWSIGGRAVGGGPRGDAGSLACPWVGWRGEGLVVRTCSAGLVGRILRASYAPGTEAVTPSVTSAGPASSPPEPLNPCPPALCPSTPLLAPPMGPPHGDLDLALLLGPTCRPPLRNAANDVDGALPTFDESRVAFRPRCADVASP